MYIEASWKRVDAALKVVNTVFHNNIDIHKAHLDGSYIHCSLVAINPNGPGSRSDRRSHAVCRHVLCVFVQALPIGTIIYIKPNLRYQVNTTSLPYDYDGVNCACLNQDPTNKKE